VALEDATCVPARGEVRHAPPVLCPSHVARLAGSRHRLPHVAAVQAVTRAAVQAARQVPASTRAVQPVQDVIPSSVSPSEAQAETQFWVFPLEDLDAVRFLASQLVASDASRFVVLALVATRYAAPAHGPIPCLAVAPQD